MHLLIVCGLHVRVRVHKLCYHTHTVGCYFCGTRADVSEHKKDCSFKDESQLLAIAMKEVTRLLLMCSVYMSALNCPKVGYIFLILFKWETNTEVVFSTV